MSASELEIMSEERLRKGKRIVLQGCIFQKLCIIYRPTLTYASVVEEETRKHLVS